MSRLSGSAALLALLVLGAGLAPASAGSTHPGPRPDRGAGEQTRTVTVRARCLSSGTVVVRQRVGPETTQVRVRGTGLPDGRWRGEHRVEVGVDDTHDTPLDVTVRRGGFEVEFDVPYAAHDAAVDLRPGGRRGADRRCFASYGEQRPFVMMGSANASVLTRRTDSGLLARTQIDCTGRSRWRLDLGIRFADTVVGAGRPATCRGYFWQARWDFGLDPRPTSRPSGLTFVGRTAGRAPVRIGYRASSPPTRPAGRWPGSLAGL